MGKADFTPGGKPVAHGTNSTYTNHRCRCSSCTKAHRIAQTCYNNALFALRRSHPKEFAALLEAENAKAAE